MRKLLSLLLSVSVTMGWAQTQEEMQSVTQEEMQSVYDAVQTPYKFGLVIAPQDAEHMVDCPTVFRMNEHWYMTYAVFDGKGYETKVSMSEDLLHWKEVGCALPYGAGTWDAQQRAGFPAFTEWHWASPKMDLGQFNGRYWMSYFGGDKPGYETRPLSIGMANIDVRELSNRLKVGNPALKWQTLPQPILTPSDTTAQWWDNETLYKSLVYRDTARTLGKEFLLYYNALGKNPETGLSAERIGLALSDDMVHWERYAGNPVFTNEVKGTITGDAQIVCFRERTADQPALYVMFYYRAFDPAHPDQAYNNFACSNDLIHWTKWEGTHLIVPSEPYDELYAHKSFVLSWQGVTYHFYCAVDKDLRRGIAVATSKEFGKSDVHFYHPFRFGNGFTNHAVIQSSRPFKMWGEAPVGAAVLLSVGKETYYAVANGYGHWETDVPIQRPTTHPIKISATTNTGLSTAIEDVVFGDVWLSAGAAADSLPLTRLTYSQADTEIRYFDAPQDGNWGEWQLGENQPKKAKRVIGIINANVNDSKLQDWGNLKAKNYKKLLMPMAPLPVKGILWYHGRVARNNKEYRKQLERTKRFILKNLDSADAEFRTE